MEFQIEIKKSPIWLDPRTKFIMLFFFGIFSVSVATPKLAIELAVFFVPILILSISGYLGTAIKSGTVFIALVTIQLILEPIVTGGFGMFLLSVSRLVRMFFPIYAMAILLIRTTTVSEFISAFRKLHLPDAFIIPVSVMFRFIPTISEEWHSIRNAMKFRGIGISPGNILKRPMQTLEYMLIPLLMSTATISEELAAASLSRGLDSGAKRTCISEVRLGVADYLLLSAMLALLILWIMGKV
ncbi:MAG: energy-coupling factor transporter transmembrane component T [Suipraeoptans sp.]